MERKDFYKKIEEYFKTLNKEEANGFVSNIIRKIPESKFEEVLCIISSNEELNISETEIVKKIESYEEAFEKIEQGELYFYAEQYEDYSYGWDDWQIEYMDKDDVGDLITDCVQYAIYLVNHKKYQYAKKLLDMVLITNYQALDEDMGGDFEISLEEMRENNLIHINLDTFCSYIIYVTYQVSKNKVEDIYSYFKDNFIFKYISIEDSFRLGIEPLENLEDFFDEWIMYLSKMSGELEYRLLKEALNYINYKDFEKYMKLIIENQPKIFIDIFEYLKKKNKNYEVIELGKKSDRSY